MEKGKSRLSPPRSSQLERPARWGCFDQKSNCWREIFQGRRGGGLSVGKLPESSPNLLWGSAASKPVPGPPIISGSPPGLAETMLWPNALIGRNTAALATQAEATRIEVDRRSLLRQMGSRNYCYDHRCFFNFGIPQLLPIDEASGTL